MPSRYYSNAAVPTSLSATIAANTTNITVAAKTGFPTVFPFTLTLDKNQTGLGEAVEVTANGTTAATDYTVTRGVDGTTAQAHNSGALVSHDHTARDYAEWQQDRDIQILTPGRGSLNMRRLSAVQGVANTYNSLLTPPAGREYIIKSVAFVNTSLTAPSRAGISISGQAHIIFGGLAGANSVPAASSQHFDLAVVLQAGETLQFYSETAALAASVTYVDVPSTDSSVRLWGSTALASTAYTTVYTAPGPILITHAVFTNVTASTLSRAYLRIGTAGTGFIEHQLAGGSFINSDTPIYMASADVLQVASESANAIAGAISGLAVTT